MAIAAACPLTLNPDTPPLINAFCREPELTVEYPNAARVNHPPTSAIVALPSEFSFSCGVLGVAGKEGCWNSVRHTTSGQLAYLLDSKRLDG